uniref:Alternative oxidase n=1 Tax=Paecilomyces sp. 'thermophila' TaxID=566408 RepID=B8XFS6_9EURO|nr:alternative oxidase [Paecilomyces sp. 'thermophila']
MYSVTVLRPTAASTCGAACTLKQAGNRVLIVGVYSTATRSQRTFMTWKKNRDETAKAVVPAARNNQSPGTRSLSSTRPRWIKDFFPKFETDKIVEVETAWKHPVYTEEQMRAISVAHREVRNWSDRVALMMVKLLRWGMDTVTGYKHPKKGKPLPPKFEMTEEKWLNRFLFLESVAGVPGMVGGMLRHLRSLRLMRRDNGWIESLLEEAYNERMHLLTFMKMAEPGWFMRLMVLGAQGVFFNAFFLSYLCSPRTCHRFVGYLEEEAVHTYTRAIEDLEAGKLPKWQNMEAPEIAVQYWNMLEGKPKMLDLPLYIRADEAKHPEVNHTMGNLNQKTDPNPYTIKFREPVNRPVPSKGTDIVKPTGWEREEVIV